MSAKIKGLFSRIKQAASEFIDDEAIKLSASLAFYTIFSVGPLLLLLITVAGIFYERAAVTTRVFNQLSTLVGASGAGQLKEILENTSKQSNTTLFGIIGGAVLLFGATGIFTEIQSSINYIWSIRAKPKKSWLKYLRDRLLSFSLIIGIGFLMLVTLVIDLLIDVLSRRLELYLGDGFAVLIKILNLGILFAVVTFLFAVIFKVLPDARVAWRDALHGSALTGIFFLIGKFLISYYISSSQTTETFGAAASIIILLSWVYYSAIILYFGAEYTKVYALNCGKGITVYETAVYIVKREAKELPVKRIPSEEQKERGEKPSNDPNAS